MEFDNNCRMWDGLYNYPHLFGGIMLTAALLGLSTSYFGGISIPNLPYFLPDLRIFHNKKSGKKHIRVFMDGCFDLMHYGHANALRQAKALGDELVVGVISDEEILTYKGPPVLSMEERLVLVSGVKWVDEVIAGAPYAITEEFMNRLFNEHRIDHIIHGDDPCFLPDGTDAYALAKKSGRYKQIKRTEGVSSTDIVGRILRSAKDTKGREGQEGSSFHEESHNINNIHGDENHAEVGHVSHFLPTSRRIVQFSNGSKRVMTDWTFSTIINGTFWRGIFRVSDQMLHRTGKGPGPNARVVYIDGAFDLFHAGHVEILKSARQLGDFLLVGIHSDHIVSEQRGSHHPIMHLHERSLSVLACRYVDEVIIGAPWIVTRDMITTFNICLVVHGTVAESNHFMNGKADPYAVPKSMGICQMLESPKNITTTSVAQRIIANHETFVKRNAKKEASEKKYYAEKKYVSGY